MCFALLLLGSGSLFGQVSGTKTIPTDYATIAAFITDINTNGIGAGGVTLNVPSGYTETAPAGGLTITATGTVANPIVIQGTGGAPKPIITASGALTAGNLNDAIIKITGSDYLTISGLDLRENAANTTTAAATNNMTEWGIALLYATTTNGAQNCTITGNTITLNKTYQNSFGIYSNSTHSAAAPTTSASATTAAGGNSGLKIYSNTISNVNIGMVVVGPTAAADHSAGLDIGGTSAGTGNSITNFGNTGSFSGYPNISGSVNGILVRNVSNINISYNTITSAVTTASVLRAIYIPSFNNISTVATVNTVDFNTINLNSGSTSSNEQGINIETTTFAPASSLSISSNNFTGLTYSAVSSGTVTGILVAPPVLTFNMNGNLFTNLSSNTTGSFTFMSANFTHPANAVKNVNNNMVVTGFNKPAAGGTVTFYTTSSSSPTTVTETNTGNNFSNITVTGATTISGWLNNDGSISSPYGPSKNISNNTFSNITGGSSAVTVMSIGYSNAATTNNVSNNTITNITGAGGIVAIGSNQGAQVFSNNTIYNLVNTGGGNVTGITITGTGATQSVSKNKIANLEAGGAAGTTYGISISSGTTLNVTNNLIGDLRTPQANTSNSLIGINITGGTTVNVHYNTVYLNGTSSASPFGSSAISVATGTTVDMQNNIFNNNSTSAGAGLSVAYRRSGVALTNYASTSNRNDFVAPVIFNDGTNTDATIGAYQTRVTPRDANSISQAPNYLSTAGSNANFLHINTAVASALESAGANVAGITTDFDGNIRQGNAGYVGTGTAPDIGADEFELAITNCSTVSGGTISPASGTICAGLTKSMTVTGATNVTGISYQWKSSTTPGGPYTNVSGGTGATTDSYTTGAMTAGTYYFVMETTCSFGPITGLSSESVLTVNPIPAVSINPSSATYCSPGGTAAALTASGASTYAWSPATGLSATTGTTVNASPSATTTYSVVGTALGCASPSTSVTVTVATMPTIASVTATPAAVCDGSNSQLNVNASLAYNSSTAAYSFAGSTGTYTPITGTTLGSSSIGDDVGIGNLPIGFTFPYNGNTFTVFGARSNGLIELGQTGATLTGFSGNSLSGNANCIAPLWDDNNTTGGSIIYATTGVAPNRVLTVQWTGMHVAGAGSATTPTIDCQVRLYETTGVVELVYGSTSAALSSPTASIGISGAIGNYLSVTPLSPANTSTVSSSTENTTISSATNFPSGTIYTFTPPPVPVLTYAWSPSTFLSATNIKNPVATGVNAPVSYNVSVTAANGCSNTGNVALTVKPLPTAPTGTNSAQCGTQIPTASVTSTTGVPTPTFVWYDALVGGNLVQSSTSATLTSNVSTTTTFGVAELSATGCESPRIAVTVTVATADNISATTSSASICLGSSINLNSANLNPTPLQNYTYSWLSTTGSGMETPVAGAAQTVTPTAIGTYTYTVTGTDGGCGASASVTVTVNALPAVTSATATPLTVCSSDQITLTGSSAVASPGTTTIGTQSSTDLGSGVYRYGYGTGDFRHQLLFTAAELDAAGLQAGNITSIAFNVTSVGAGAGNNYTIKMGHTGATAATTAFQASPALTVYTNAAYTAVNGLNTHTFSTPFNWDGASNVLIEICYNVSTTSGTSSTLSVSTPASTRNVSLLGTVNACTNPTGGTYALRPLVTFGGQVGTNSNASLNWSWTPGTGLNTRVANTSVSNTTGSPISQVFTVTATNPTTGCVATATTPAVTINPAPAAPVANNGTRCGAGIPIASVTGSGTPGNTYSWYLAATGGTALPGETGSSLSAYSISTTTTFYVSEGNGTCSSARTAVTATVTAAPAVTVAGTATICNGGSTALTASSSNDPNYTYTWSGSLGTGATVTAAPTANTTYTVTATDASGGANNGCITSATYAITVNPSPTAVTANSSLATICSGTTINLTSSSTANTYVGATLTEGFETFPPTGWTMTNAGSGNAWESATGSAHTGSLGMRYKWNAANAGNAWAITPQLFMLAGQTYNVSFWYKVEGATFPEKLKVTVGNATTVASQTTVLWNNNGGASLTNTTWAQGTATYTPTVSGNYYVGFNCYSDADQFYLHVDDVSIQYSTLGGTSTYAWTSSPAGFTSSVQNPTNVAPTVNTTYTVTATNSLGCSNSASVSVVVNQPSTSTATVTECDSYLWNGTTYTTSGVYTHTSTNSVGCDSVATLNLTIKNSTTSTIPVTACSSYTWAQTGLVYNASGLYRDTIANAAGCDSVITLNLTINMPSSATVTATGCGSYVWALNGQTYTTSGSYTHTIPNSVNCDSVVTLNLTMGQANTGIDTQVACETFTWIDGVVYTASTNTPTFTLTNASGCDSVVTLHLTINQNTGSTVAPVTTCGSYTWPLSGQTYTTSGAYTHTIPNAAGCDSVITLNLTIHPQPVVTITNNGNGSFVASSTVSGTIAWLNCTTNTLVSGATTATYTPTANGSYAAIVTTANGCSDTSACLTINNVGIKENSVSSISVHPNPTHDFVIVTMEAATATVDVFDAQGKLVQTAQIKSGDQIDLGAYERGVYTLKIKTEIGTSVERIVKN